MKGLAMCQLKHKQTNWDKGSILVVSNHSEACIPFSEHYPASLVAIWCTNYECGAHLQPSDPVLVQLYTLCG